MPQLRLKDYLRKRNFTRTPEPTGTQAESRKGNQHTGIFVVQKHRASHLHYDFRIEHEGVMLSWAVAKGPSPDPSVRRLAMMTEPHPMDYNDFEGVIPEGEYGGGTVMIWDWGTFELEESTPAESLKRGEVKFRLKGVRLCGRYALVRTRSEKDWLLIKKKDECADPNFNIETFTTSVKTGRTKEEIEQGKDAVWSSNRGEGEGGLINLANAEKGPMPRSLDPMKAQLVDEAFDDDRWLFEVKWDGIRLISFIDEGKVSLQTRAGRIVDAEYPQLQAISGLVKAELFPMHVRALGVGLSYAIANAAFGGTAEYVALWFKSIGHETIFFWYVAGMCGIALIAALAMPETRREGYLTADEARHLET